MPRRAHTSSRSHIPPPIPDDDSHLPAYLRKPKPRLGYGAPALSTPTLPPVQVSVGRMPSVAQTVVAMLHHHALDWRRSHQRNVHEYLLSGRFPAWCDAEGIGTIDALTTQKVADFLALQKQLLKPATVAKYRQHLRSLADFCNATPGYGDGLRDIDRIPAVKQPKRRNFTVGLAWTKEEEDLVVAACATERDRLMVELMLATGVRVSELCALRLDNLLLQARPPRIYVVRSIHDDDMTKSGEPRTTGFRKTYASLPRRLERWLQVGRDTEGTKPYREIFLSARTGTPLSVWGVEQLFQRLQAASGVRCHPHKTRHTWATRCAESGVPPAHLMVMGGWKSLDMVLRYYTANEEEALASLDRASG